MRKWLIAGPVLLLVLAATASAVCTRPDPTHGLWTTILRLRVHQGQVDYAALAREDSAQLAAYLEQLSGTCARDYERFNQAEKIAFWINTYNAYTVKLILDNYPIGSIRQIGWLPGAAFRERFIPMAGLKGGSISLNDIEHGTLRSAFSEPRVHFALVCASRSCPPLRNEAYRGSDLDHQLEDQARSFLHDTRMNRYIVASRTLEVSAIFGWFHQDFEAAAGSVPAFAGRYLELPAGPDPAVRYLPYDWQLNDRER